ncbi:alkaline phosphatase family protein [Leptospira sp. 96542]|nr:alkaline phosphatase family protein [Leptospira sp. 96542]
MFNSVLGCQWESDYKKAASLSIQEDTDLILAPYPFNIFDRESRDAITLSHYSKEELQNILSEHGLSWEELKLSWNLQEENEEISKEVNYTSHYTQYAYDVEIPVWIYGPKWLHNGIYSDRIHQQHLPSILAKILQFPFSNQLDISFLDKLFTKEKSKPKIIVTVVIDQGGKQLYKAHPGSYPFLESLKNQSAYFNKAKVGHMESHTAVGHMAIGTGTYPKDSKVYSNEYYSFQNGSVVDRPVYQGKNKNWDILELKSASLSDEWDMYNHNEPVIISQCYAGRASIGMAGHGKLFENQNVGFKPDADYVYWQDVKNLSWNTLNSAYSLPNSVNKYNLYTFYMNHKKEISTHFEANNPLELIQKIHHFQGSEFQAKMDGALFRDVVAETILKTTKDKDGFTDLAYVTLKATDAVGHLFGWESGEAKQVLIATDSEVKKIFEFLQTNFGEDFIMIVTADHGAAPMPEISNSSYLTHEEFFAEMQSLLPEEKRNSQSVIKWITHSQLSLNRDVMAEHKISEDAVIEKIKQIQLKDKPFFRRVWKRNEILDN